MYRCLIAVFILIFGISSPLSAQFIAMKNKVKDLSTSTTWLRCSVGQAWDPAFATCTGTIIKLNHTQVKFATKEANKQLGGNWRLPTHTELKSLVCNACPPPKIKAKYFPNISPEAYWTSDKNTMNSKQFWSVNFMTGHSYSRFFPYQALPVLLVEKK